MCILHRMQLFDALFAPIARLLVARGIPFPDLVERMKAHYVQAALAQAGDRTTDSRVSVMTGLQRRDVARLRGEDVKDRRPNHLSRLVSLWQTAAEWSRDGQPRPLSRADFDLLAQSVRRDVHPRTMLDTLVSAGTVTLSAGRPNGHAGAGVLSAAGRIGRPAGLSGAQPGRPRAGGVRERAGPRSAAL
jgi:hypothetical protein